MVVDDEYLMREGISRTTPWEQLGYQLVGTAANGREALERLEELKADVLITDIKMPVMDGLELARAIREREPGLQVVILSGYDEFAYAQQGMRYGVEYYILKIDIAKGRLEEVLREIRAKLEKDEAAAGRQRALGRKRGRLIQRSLIEGRLYGGPLLDMAALEPYASWAQGESYCVVCVLLEMESAGRDIASLVAYEQRVKEAYDALRKRFARADCETFLLHESQVALVYHRPRAGEQELLNTVMDAWSGIGALFPADLRLNAYVGIGEPATGLAGVREAYRCARLLAASAPKSPDAVRLRLFSDSAPPRELAGFRDKKELLENIFMGDEAASVRKMRQIIGELNLSSALTGAYLRRLVEELTVVLNWRLGEEGKVLPPPRLPPSETPGGGPAVPEWAAGMVRELAAQCLALRSQSLEESIRFVGSYIRDNYDKRLTLHAIAAYLNVTPSYMSMLFKKHMGVGFKQYLIRIRLEKAQALLLQEDVRVSEAAQRVGFTDIRHFSRLYCKAFGHYPKEERAAAPAQGGPLPAGAADENGRPRAGCPPADCGPAHHREAGRGGETL